MRYPDIRMSLDYSEDFDFFKEIFEALYKPGKTITLPEIIIFLKKNPRIININKNLQKKYWKRYKKLSTNKKFKGE